MPHLSGAAWQAAHPTGSRKSGVGPQRYALGDRFISKVRAGASPDDCWEWLAGRAHLGSRHYLPYGVMGGSGAGKTITAHRASWLIFRGPIPPGLDVLHHCDNPPCANPRHLFLGTQGDNNRDRSAKGRNGSVKDRPWALRPLTDDQVRAVRQARGSRREIVARTGASYTQVGRILRGEQYRHVDRP